MTSSRPGDGERRAAIGLHNQYIVSGKLIYDALVADDLEWIHVADPNAGRVDDLIIVTSGQAHGYQVKWEQYPGLTTFNDLTTPQQSKPSLFRQLADGWRLLKDSHPQKRAIVHLVTNTRPSNNPSQRMPSIDQPPTPYHFAAFIAQAWTPARHGVQIERSSEWGAIWDAIEKECELDRSDLADFVCACSLDFGFTVVEDDHDLSLLADLLFSVAASPERAVRLSRRELVDKLGWQYRFNPYNWHAYPAPVFQYCPIESTVSALETCIRDLAGGYIGVVGPPGSGKSTLLSRTLRSLPVNLVCYYAFVPEDNYPSAVRGESISFLHDVTLAFEQLGVTHRSVKKHEDRESLLRKFAEQLRSLGDIYREKGRKTVILIDGLDHIAREQKTDRSLVADLPIPAALPEGVFVVLGSQTFDIPDLPSAIHRCLRAKERNIPMGRLSPADVHALSRQALPDLDANQSQRLSELSDGNPLYLTYLLKRLLGCQSIDQRLETLDRTVPYDGDIENYYWGFWRSGDDDVLAKTMGLLARVRGAIPVVWVQEWLEDTTLRRLWHRFGHCFEREGQHSWRFFHNSFRIFLGERTSETVPGSDPDAQERHLHRELAIRYERSSAPFRGEAIYHYHYAGDYDSVLRLATTEFFRQQLGELKPLQSIRDDLVLAVQAAAELGRTVELVRLVLICAVVEQRIRTLDSSFLPEQMIEFGDALGATQHIREGNHLLLGRAAALRLSVCLHQAGLPQEGRRVFDLAEPLGLLVGWQSPDHNHTLSDDHDLLDDWVQAAAIFCQASDIVAKIDRALKASDDNQGDDKDQQSLEKRTWLLYRGAVASYRSGNADTFDTLTGELQGSDGLPTRPWFFSNLRAAQHAASVGQRDQARSLYLRLADVPVHEHIMGDFQETVEARISLAELAQGLGFQGKARSLLSSVPPIPLFVSGTGSEHDSPLWELRLRSSRLHYLLGTSATPGSLLDTARRNTTFPDYVDSQRAAVFAQVALAAYTVARLWAWGKAGKLLSATSFMQEVAWILDAVGTTASRWPPMTRYALGSSPSSALRELVKTAREHGSKVLLALREAFESRWTDKSEASSWPASLRRELILAFVDNGTDRMWAAHMLDQISAEYMVGASTYERIDLCREQAKAWNKINRKDLAAEEIRKMINVAGWILDSDDGQLREWLRWFKRSLDIHDPCAVDKLCCMWRRVLSAQGIAAGVGNAARELLSTTFRWSPWRAVTLVKPLLELGTLDHGEALETVFAAALDQEKATTAEVLCGAENLLVPFARGMAAEFPAQLITTVAKHDGLACAKQAVSLLVNSIRTVAPSSERPSLIRGISEALGPLGIEPSAFGMPEADTSRYNPSAHESAIYKLKLVDGRELTLEQVLVQARTPQELRSLMSAQDTESYNYFAWSLVVQDLAARLGSRSDILEVEGLLRDSTKDSDLASSLMYLSTRSFELGLCDLSWCLSEKALTATTAYGTVYHYMEGQPRNAALSQMISIDPERGHREAAMWLARDLAKSVPTPGALSLCFGELMRLLFSAVPVDAIWLLVENHLDELFTHVRAARQDICDLLYVPIEASSDTPDAAVAHLLVEYLDHPSFEVAQKAVRALAQLLASGSSSVVLQIGAALGSTAEITERALMALDAASVVNRECIGEFSDRLMELRQSHDFTLRFISTAVYGRLVGQPTPLPKLGRTVPVFEMQIPIETMYHTEHSAGSDSPKLVGDLAYLLRPLDLQLRAVARVANVPE